jgi:hypothetical protein
MFFPSLVIGPAHLSGGDVAVLPFLCPATDQDYETLTVFAEIDAVAGAKIDLVFENAGSYTFRVGPVARSIRVRAIVTLAAAVAFSPSNHVAKRFLPVSSM